MPTSAIETVLSKATKIKQGPKEDRQKFLVALSNGIQDLTDDQWEALGEGEQGDAAQKWANEATKAIKAKKSLKDFADVGDVKPGKSKDDDDDRPSRRGSARDDDGDGEDDKPSRRGAKDKDDDDDKPRRGRRSDDDDAKDGDDDKPRGRRGAKDKEEAEEERPRGRRSAKDEDDDKPARRGRDKDKEEDDDKPRRGRGKDDDKPARGKDKEKDKPEARSSGVKPSGSGIKNRIKLALLDDLSLSPDELVKKLGKSGQEVSKVTVSNIRAEFRHTLKLLKEEKINCAKLEGI